MKRIHVILIAAVAGFIIGCAVPAHAAVNSVAMCGEHSLVMMDDGQRVVIDGKDFDSVPDSGAVTAISASQIYASQSEQATITIELKTKQLYLHVNQELMLSKCK